MDDTAKLKSAMEVLKPFADVYAMYERNSYLEGFDLIARQHGRILGHAGFGKDDLKSAHDLYLSLGGEIEI